MPKDPRNPDDVNTEAEDRAADSTRYRVMHVRDAIYGAFSQGSHPYEVAQQIKDRVGLSTKEWRSLDNFASRLMYVAVGRAAGAKEMEMLGRVGGKTAFRKVGLTNYRVQVLINKHQDIILRRRVEGVATTVTIDASKEAQVQL